MSTVHIRVIISGFIVMVCLISFSCFKDQSKSPESALEIGNLPSEEPNEVSEVEIPETDNNLSFIYGDGYAINQKATHSDRDYLVDWHISLSDSMAEDSKRSYLLFKWEEDIYWINQETLEDGECSLRPDDDYPARIYLDDQGFYRASFADTDEPISFSLIFSKYYYYFSYNTSDIQDLPHFEESSLYKPLHLGIQGISATSFLSETMGGKEVPYLPENLEEKIYSRSYGTYSRYFYNTKGLPWVEGVPGNGEGESLTIDFSTSTYGISFLGGFVDFQRPHLFRQNGRPKKIRISSPSFEDMVIDIHDSVQFTDVLFPESTEQISIEILEVYPGSKWQDTCVSAIIPMNDDIIVFRTSMSPTISNFMDSMLMVDLDHWSYSTEE